MEKNFKDRVVLVTGGSRGIGREICKRFARCGAYVFVNFSSSPDAAEETAALCRAEGAQAETIGFNVGESLAVNAAIDVIKEKAGRLDVLVNNAGISIDGLLIRMKDEDWARTMEVNLNGAFYCARAAAKIMMKARSGRIINMSSIVGEMGNAGQAPYVSSKAGMIGLTKALARELAPRNITVNAITPGFIETEMTDKLDDKLKEDLLKSVPLSRFGQAAEVASLTTFLASDAASYITGQVIGINGGMYM